MRELVDDEVHPDASQSALASTSGQDSTTGPRGIASPANAHIAVNDAGLVLALPAGDELARVHDDVLEAVVEREVELEDEHARLDRDDRALQRRDLVAARADDSLGVEEQHDLLAQPRQRIGTVDREERKVRTASFHSASGMAEDLRTCLRRHWRNVSNMRDSAS